MQPQLIGSDKKNDLYPFCPLDEDKIREENRGFINDDDDDEDEVSGSDGESKRKKRRRDNDDDDDDDMDANNLDDDDLDLIEENIGVKINRKVR